VAAGTGRLVTRIALAALVLGLVATTSGFVVSAASESNRARRFQRAAAPTNDDTRRQRGAAATLDKDARAAEKLLPRLRRDAALFSTIDSAPLLAYERLLGALNALTHSLGNVVDRGPVPDVHAALDGMVSEARSRLDAFDQTMTRFKAGRDEVRAAVRAARAR
jgi:hypothetical protein